MFWGASCEQECAGEGTRDKREGRGDQVMIPAHSPCSGPLTPERLHMHVMLYVCMCCHTQFESVFYSIIFVFALRMIWSIADTNPRHPTFSQRQLSHSSSKTFPTRACVYMQICADTHACISAVWTLLVTPCACAYAHTYKCVWYHHRCKRWTTHVLKPKLKPILFDGSDRD